MRDNHREDWHRYIHRTAWACSYCEKVFNTKDLLARHLDEDGVPGHPPNLASFDISLQTTRPKPRPRSANQCPLCCESDPTSWVTSPLEAAKKHMDGESKPNDLNRHFATHLRDLAFLSFRWWDLDTGVEAAGSGDNGSEQSFTSTAGGLRSNKTAQSGNSPVWTEWDDSELKRLQDLRESLEEESKPPPEAAAHRPDPNITSDGATAPSYEKGPLDWNRKAVFRARGLPGDLSTPAAVTNLLSRVLDVPSGDIVVQSVAAAPGVFGDTSRTATLQMRSVPKCLRDDPAAQEWAFPIPDGPPNSDVVALDIHFQGITVLYDPPPSQHRADCIAISGLASHPFGSWQPPGDRTFMWIRDAIPTVLPEVRTIVYGYDSELTDSRSFQSISDIARALVLHLRSNGWNLRSSKPIVFLAHSLGGLILKEAIVQMADRDKSVSGILNNICGAIMFGVPSLGMEQSHLLAMVDGQPNESLVQDLSYNRSGYIRQLNARFEGLSFLKQAKIFWAYETKESATVVVSSFHRPGNSLLGEI